jgi:GNAT superfamily N-acetyltransferase
MTIRPAHPGDVDFVVGLVPRFVENGVAGGHTREEVVAGTARVLSEALRAPRPDELLLVATDEHDAPCGFVYAVTEHDFFTGEAYAHVSEIAVVRSGAGTGAALMEAAEAWSRACGHRLMTLNTVEANAPARRFYERRGFGIAHVHHIKRL